MNDNKYEIRDYDKIPRGEPGWSPPFRVGDTVEVLGQHMVVIRVKKLRREIHLRLVDKRGDA